MYIVEASRCTGPLAPARLARVASISRKVPAMRTYAAAADAPRLLFAHGAGAGETHPWMTDVASRLCAAGVTVVTFEFPYMQAGRRAPDRGPLLERAYAEAWREVAGHLDAATARRAFVGGKSMGGRIATQAAAAGLFTPAPAGIVCFGYPLHPPAKPEVRRDSHLSSVPCPILFLHGTRDGFGSPDEMRALGRTLPSSTLVLAPDGDHSLDAPKRVDPAGTTRHAAITAAADWMRKHGYDGGDRGDRGDGGDRR